MNFKILKLDHIGIAVEKIDDLINFYRDGLGLDLTGREEITDQKVSTAFLRLGEVDIELLEPTEDDGPIRKFLSSGKRGIHHIAVQVDDIEMALKELKEAGVKLIDESPRIGAHHKKIAFVHPGSTGGVLLELCQNVDE